MKNLRYALTIGAVVAGLLLARGYYKYGSRFHGGTTAQSDPVVLPKLDRDLRDIVLTKELTEQQVAARWGPSDSRGGFGADYVLIYALGHGQEVWFHFLTDAPHRLDFAALMEANGHRETLWSR
jgi:hypothetical protein